jgi:hypothetical protein
VSAGRRLLAKAESSVVEANNISAIIIADNPNYTNFIFSIKMVQVKNHLYIIFMKKNLQKSF